MWNFSLLFRYSKLHVLHNATICRLVAKPKADKIQSVGFCQPKNCGTAVGNVCMGLPTSLAHMTSSPFHLVVLQYAAWRVVFSLVFVNFFFILTPFTFWNSSVVMWTLFYVHILGKWVFCFLLLLMVHAVVQGQSFNTCLWIEYWNTFEDLISSWKFEYFQIFFIFPWQTFCYSNFSIFLKVSTFLVIYFTWSLNLWYRITVQFFWVNFLEL